MCQIEQALKNEDNFNLRLDNSGKWLVWMEDDAEWLVQGRAYKHVNDVFYRGDNLGEALEALLK